MTPRQTPKGQSSIAPWFGKPSFYLNTMLAEARGWSRKPCYSPEQPLKT